MRKGRVDRELGRLRHGHDRQAEFVAAEAKAGGGVFRAAGIALEEQRAMQRGEPILDRKSVV